MNGTVNVAFRGQVQDGAWPVFSQEPVNQSPVADVAVDKNMPGITFQRSQVFKVAGVNQFVQVNNRFV
jgi:hypothetical protein